MSNNLGRILVAAGQNQKEVSINDSDGVLDASITDAVTYEISSSNARTLTTAELANAQFLVIDEEGGDPADADITLTLPANGRGTFSLQNDTAFNVTCEISGQPLASPVVAAGDVVLLSSDGVDVRTAGGNGGSNGGGSLAGLQVFPRIPFRGALAKHSTTQAISAGTDTTVAFDQEDYDTDNFHDTSSNNSRITIPPNVTKVRLIGGIDTSTPTTVDDIKMWITKNGSGAGAKPGIAMRSSTSFNGSEGIILVSPVIDVVAGDHFELEVNFNVAGSLDGTAATFLFVQVVEHEAVAPERAFRGVLAKRITSAQAITAATNTAIQMNGEDYDTDVFHDTSTLNERLTIPVGSGVKRVRVTGGLNTTTPSSGTVQGWIAKNGAAFPAMMVGDSHGISSAEEEALNMDTGVIDVVEGDFFELFVRTANTGSVVDNDATFLSLEVIEQVAPSLDLASPFRGARVGKNVTQAVSGASTLTWQTEDYDTNDIHDPAVNERLTVPAGVTKVRLNGGVTFSGTPSSGAVTAWIEKNDEGFPGQGVSTQAAFSGTEGVALTTPVLDVVEGDYFKFELNTALSGVVRTTADGGSFFSMEIIEVVPTQAKTLPLNLYIDGIPGVTSVPIAKFIAIEPFLLPDDLDGSAAHVVVAPSSAAVIDVHKNEVSIGSISIATTGIVTFSTSGSAPEVFNTNDRLSLIAPADWLTLEDITVTLRALLLGR